MPRFLISARWFLRRRSGKTGTQSSSDRSIESLETGEYQQAELSLMHSIYGDPASSLAPKSTMTKTTDLQSHMSTTACPQPGQPLVNLNSRSESVGTEFDLPVRSLSTSTGPARSTIFDHCAANRSSAINSALNLVADTLSAIYSKCLIYPKGEYTFPNIRPVRELSGNLPAQITYSYEKNECYRLYLYQDEDGGHAQKAIASGQRLISRVEYVQIGPFGDISSTKHLPSTITRQEYSHLLNMLQQPLTYWNPAPMLRRDEALRIVILKLARNDEQKRIEVDFQLFLRPGLAQGDLDRSVDRPGESYLSRNSAPESSAALAAADPELNIVHNRPPSLMHDQHLELAAMFWKLIDDLEFEHQKRNQAGSPLFLASGCRGVAKEFHLSIKIEDGRLEAWESLAHRLDSLKLPRLRYPEIKNKRLPRNISFEAEKIDILTAPVDRSNLKCDWENFTLERCSIKSQKKDRNSGSALSVQEYEAAALRVIRETQKFHFPDMDVSILLANVCQWTENVRTSQVPIIDYHDTQAWVNHLTSGLDDFNLLLV
ncbi:hypothetical protein FFLO_02748 [Filobasidium floriforme]|uniref:Uncharacterized protein n=1 Tax=Filobasidium floriforme TaxID=5210 RepID=A0A8K0JMS1_9TREE|nr:uncharacterized protein HD553DRAFT_324797 [Filobasidium floriforme]KAG7561847.1 hypothetical protein FFLO_02748 [Filobasidium floriforme]KAH8083246.1 hypothetical protein HD553DRAFT_324797 [Filobasidium floriforme]